MIAAERDAELAKLDVERARVEERTGERLGEVESEQRAVLAELNADGRSADELAALFGVPVKRVRTLLRAARSATAAGPADPAATRTATPAPVAAAATSAGPAEGAVTAACDGRPVTEASAVAASETAGGRRELTVRGESGSAI